jgi:ABC-2 type transport system ATP-binding protein
VFLDELTTGLDPQARRAIWELVRGIRARGKTVFLTTHLMEEAERLCDRVAIIDRGKIIDIGTPDELIRRHAPTQTVIVATDHQQAEQQFRMLPEVHSIAAQDGRLTIRGQGDLVTRIIECISEHHMRVTDFRTERSTLEDVFLTVTGHSMRD